MTPTGMSLLVLLAAGLMFAEALNWMIEAGPEPVTPDPAFVYEAPFGQHGAKLPQRPEGMAALKGEIALAPVEPVRLPLRKHHPNWEWDTDEYRAAVASYFADQPDDRAVQREYVGAGHVR